MSRAGDIASRFYDAIIAASYITDTVVKDRVMDELAETNRIIRQPAMPKDIASGIRQAGLAAVNEITDRRV